MKILNQFQNKTTKAEDLHKLSILRSYCKNSDCLEGCIVCHEITTCCGLVYAINKYLPDNRIECRLPYRWQTPEKDPEYNEEDLDEAIKWWREIIQTDKYKAYSRYIQ